MQIKYVRFKDRFPCICKYLSIKNIAELTGIPTNSVKTYKYNAATPSQERLRLLDAIEFKLVKTFEEISKL